MGSGGKVWRVKRLGLIFGTQILTMGGEEYLIG